MSGLTRRQRLGIDYMGGVERRQIRVGKPKEPVAVLRLLSDSKANDEIVLTRRMLLFLIDGMAYEGTVIEPLIRPHMNPRLPIPAAANGTES